MTGHCGNIGFGLPAFSEFVLKMESPNSHFFNISDSPEKLTDDHEIQNWGQMLADPEEGLGIKVVLILHRFLKFSGCTVTEL